MLLSDACLPFSHFFLVRILGYICLNLPRGSLSSNNTDNKEITRHLLNKSHPHCLPTVVQMYEDREGKRRNLSSTQSKPHETSFIVGSVCLVCLKGLVFSSYPSLFRNLIMMITSLTWSSSHNSAGNVVALEVSGEVFETPTQNTETHEGMFIILNLDLDWEVSGLTKNNNSMLYIIPLNVITGSFFEDSCERQKDEMTWIKKWHNGDE